METKTKAGIAGATAATALAGTGTAAVIADNNVTGNAAETLALYNDVQTADTNLHPLGQYNPLSNAFQSPPSSYDQSYIEKVNDAYNAHVKVDDILRIQNPGQAIEFNALNSDKGYVKTAQDNINAYLQHHSPNTSDPAYQQLQMKLANAQAVYLQDLYQHGNGVVFQLEHTAGQIAYTTYEGLLKSENGFEKLGHAIHTAITDTVDGIKHLAGQINPLIEASGAAVLLTAGTIAAVVHHKRSAGHKDESEMQAESTQVTGAGTDSEEKKGFIHSLMARLRSSKNTQEQQVDVGLGLGGGGRGI